MGLTLTRSGAGPRVVDSSGATLGGVVFELGAVTVPATYPAGGIDVVPATGYTDLEALIVNVHAAGALDGGPAVVVELNTPSAGQGRVRLYRARYDRLNSVDAVSGAPVGVTVPNAAGAVTAAEAAHTHGVGTLAGASESAHTHAATGLTTANEAAHTHAATGLTTANEAAHTHTHVHGHGSGASSETGSNQSPGIAPTTGVAGNAADDATHRHSIDNPIQPDTDAGTAHAHTVAGATAAGAAHAHTVAGATAAGAAHAHALSGSTAATSHEHVTNILYDHAHASTLAATPTALQELPAGTSLAGVALGYVAIGR